MGTPLAHLQIWQPIHGCVEKQKLAFSRRSVQFLFSPVSDRQVVGSVPILIGNLYRTGVGNIKSRQRLIKRVKTKSTKSGLDPDFDFYSLIWDLQND